MKRYLSTILIVVFIITTMVLPASAAQIWTSSSYSRPWSQMIVVERTNKKAATALVSVFGGARDAVDIQMLNRNNRLIWSENRTIVCNSRDIYSKRTYSFGNDHTIYRLRFRSSVAGRSQQVTVTAKKNCKVHY